MWSERFYKWQLECYRIKEKRNKNLFLAALLITHAKNLANNKKIKKLLQTKNIKYHLPIFPVKCLEENRMRNFIRMTNSQFEDLLSFVGPILVNKTIIESMTPSEKLKMTLRFLATGNKIDPATYPHIVTENIMAIVSETCEAIWYCLNEKMFPKNLTKKEWLKIADDYEEKYNFPQCCGAIDGKRILIQCPGYTLSEFYNYRGSHGIILFGICDVNYKLLFVDINTCKQMNDISIFKDSSLSNDFGNNLPDEKPLSFHEKNVPYVIIGDEAFPLQNYLMRPYSQRKNYTEKQAVYNYRLNRAKKTIENTFQIIITHWKLLNEPIKSSINHAKKYIQAIVCLHNYLHEQDIGINEYIDEKILNLNEDIPFTTDFTACLEITKMGNNHAIKSATVIREEFARYFNAEGAIQSQYNDL